MIGPILLTSILKYPDNARHNGVGIGVEFYMNGKIALYNDKSDVNCIKDKFYYRKSVKLVDVDNIFFIPFCRETKEVFDPIFSKSPNYTKDNPRTVLKNIDHEFRNGNYRKYGYRIYWDYSKNNIDITEYKYIKFISDLIPFKSDTGELSEVRGVVWEINFDDDNRKKAIRDIKLSKIIDKIKG